MILSTPDHAVWQERGIYWDDHIGERTKSELVELIGSYFVIEDIYGQSVRLAKRSFLQQLRPFVNILKKIAEKINLKGYFPTSLRHYIDARTSPVDEDNVTLHKLHSNQTASGLLFVCKNKKGTN